jgi:hypothetical protein
MKYFSIIILAIVLGSCGQKIAFTNQIKDEFGLDAENQIKKVQFYISQTIILQRIKQSGSQGTTESGALVTNKNKEEDRITIQAQTPAVFESYGKTGEMIIRFEVGQGRFLSFNVRQENATAKYYLVAEWDMNKGGELTYGNQKYTIQSSAGNAYLMVKLKKLQKTKRKDRVVKGMRV